MASSVTTLAKNFGCRTHFVAFSYKLRTNILENNISKFTPIKRELYGNNIRGNDSFIASPRLYRCIDEKITQIPAYLNQCLNMSSHHFRKVRTWELLKSLVLRCTYFGLLKYLTLNNFSRPNLKSFEIFCKSGWGATHTRERELMTFFSVNGYSKIWRDTS